MRTATEEQQGNEQNGTGATRRRGRGIDQTNQQHDQCARYRRVNGKGERVV